MISIRSLHPTAAAFRFSAFNVSPAAAAGWLVRSYLPNNRSAWLRSIAGPTYLNLVVSRVVACCKPPSFEWAKLGLRVICRCSGCKEPLPASLFNPAR